MNRISPFRSALVALVVGDRAGRRRSGAIAGTVSLSVRKPLRGARPGRIRKPRPGGNTRARRIRDPGPGSHPRTGG